VPDSELDFLRSENARLKSLLDAQGIPWELPHDMNEPGGDHDSSESVAESNSVYSQTAIRSHSIATTTEKISLFRRLFSGREDVFALRWESQTGGSGYSPACGNEWKKGICEKPRIKCGECQQRSLRPINDQVIFDHLSGKQVVGVYPLLIDNTCRFLAVDFDEADWRGDARAFMESCREFGIHAGLEISRSGAGAHVWIFFSAPVPARNARRLGAVLISHTCMQTRQLSLASYDRFFPNQDSLPAGGFGNLIGLPLQKKSRKIGASVFVDDNFKPWPDQWTFLSEIEPFEAIALEECIENASGGHPPLDVAFVENDEAEKPWKPPSSASIKLKIPVPESIPIVLADRIYIAKDELPQALLNRIIRLAAFQNPEFYKAQALRLSVWDKPRIIGCADNYPNHIALPRGCQEDLEDLLQTNGIVAITKDERASGSPINAEFTGTLRDEQRIALRAVLAYETGVLCAPTAFGKTVIAAALIAKRKTSTLIIVHRTDLARQWSERLGVFLEIDKKSIGFIGGGKKSPSGMVDIAVMQSLAKVVESDALFERYGQVLVDECHHLSAFSFESVLKRFKARYVLGLTATPSRRDGHHPIIFMQCGPIRYKATRGTTAITSMKIIAKQFAAPLMPDGSRIQDIFHILIRDAVRNSRIVDDISQTYEEGHKILVLTERTEHLEILAELIGSEKTLIKLHGRLKKQKRDEAFAALDAMNHDEPRIILATGKLIGEGFDHPALDTLILAMPISWKGTLQQYAGRLHREHSGKTGIEIHDYIEKGNTFLSSMWGKRRKGYLAMGYTIEENQDQP
jgi:superfamily II DNA or RNA helicase